MKVMNGKDVVLGRRNQITLPRELVPKGVSMFRCEKQGDGSLLLVPQVTIPASQAYFWTERWQEGERRASEDIREGRTKAHDSAEHLIKRLRRNRSA